MRDQQQKNDDKRSPRNLCCRFAARKGGVQTPGRTHDQLKHQEQEQLMIQRAKQRLVLCFTLFYMAPHQL